MRLTEHLKLENISTQLKAVDKGSALLELAELSLTGQSLSLTPELVRKTFEAREMLATTGVGSGVAIPHGRFSIPSFIVAVALSPRGLGFEAIDHQPVHVLVAILAPDGQPAAQLRMLARVSRILRPDSFREQLVKLEDARAVLEALGRADAELGD